MIDRTLVTLGQICGKPTYGAIASSTPTGDGPLFVRQTDVVGGRIDWDTVPRCDLAASEVDKFAIAQDDLLISRLGSVGRSARVRDTRGAVYAGYLVRFQVDRRRADPAFVGYQLQSPEWWAHVEAVRSGAVQATLNAQQMAAFQFRLPQLVEQRGIAEVLGALDDKIAANTRSVNVALELADAEFAKQVKAAAPGQTFGEMATVGGGGTPRTSNEDYWNGDVSWATPTDITALSAPYLTTTARLISDEGLANCSSSLYPTGSILMTSRATIGAFALAQKPTAVNQGFIVVNANDPALQMWLFHEMRSRIPEFISHANGATFLELSRGKFKAFPVRVADAQVMADFGVFAQALHEQAAAVTLESAQLAATRDCLLPLLMSGRVSVKDAESVVGGVL